MLGLRILSAAVLAPIALAAAWAGSWAFVALCTLAVGLLSWEWTRLCQGHYGLGGAIIAVFGMIAVVLGQIEPAFAFPAIALGAVLSAWTSRPRSLWWMVAGAIYIGIPALSLVWLREQGRETLIWLLLAVWATDIGAYAVGRTVGGPKLLVRVSPKKTWSGLIGGIASAALVGSLFVAFSLPEGPGWVKIATLSAVLAVVSQAGDLAESWMKRYFGVKDSSGLIPGHGGVMDRLDGLLAAAPALAVLCLFLGGGLSRW